MLRALKIILVVFIALQGLFYGLQNIVNLDAAYGAIATVLTMADHQWYGAHFGPPVTSPALIWAALWAVIAGEILVGLLGFKGALDMTRALRKAPAIFNAAKKYAALSVALAIFVWFGLFMVVGGAYFQMWQTEIGAGSLEGAFMYTASSALVFLFVAQADA